jgi:hypothetical protein
MPWEIIVSDLIDPATGLPLKFPNRAQEACARAREFRRLSPQERWKQIAELMEIGMKMVRNSPRRAEIERRLEAQEAEWQRLQRKLFSEHGA